MHTPITLAGRQAETEFGDQPGNLAAQWDTVSQKMKGLGM